jgi:hypothetical protein
MEGNGHHRTGIGMLETSGPTQTEAGGEPAGPQSEPAAGPTEPPESLAEDVETVESSPRAPRDVLTELVETVLGTIGLVVAVIDSAIRQAIPGAGPHAAAARSSVRIVTATCLELTAGSIRLATWSAGRLVGITRPVASAVLDMTPARAPADAITRMAADWSERALAEQERRERFAASVIEVLVPQVAQAVVEHVDLDIVIEGIDLDGIIQRVDIDSVLARVDLDRIVGRIDIDAIASKIDLDAIASRIDIDAIVRRVDLQAIVNQLDLPAITQEVIEEVNIGELIRESTGSITTETVDAIRYQGMNADRLVSRIVDRVLMRRKGRDGGSIPGAPAAGDPLKALDAALVDPAVADPGPDTAPS